MATDYDKCAKLMVRGRRCCCIWDKDNEHIATPSKKQFSSLQSESGFGASKSDFPTWIPWYPFYNQERFSIFFPG